MNIIERVQALSLSASDYIVIGSGILDALGLRAANDIDLVVSESLFEKLHQDGWKGGVNNGHQVLYHDDTEAYLTWDRDDFMPNLAELKSDEVVIEGIPFCSPQRVLNWKRRMSRPKDQQDIVLLEEWLRANPTQFR